MERGFVKNGVRAAGRGAVAVMLSRGISEAPLTSADGHRRRREGRGPRQHVPARALRARRPVAPRRSPREAGDALYALGPRRRRRGGGKASRSMQDAVHDAHGSGAPVDAFTLRTAPLAPSAASRGRAAASSRRGGLAGGAQERRPRAGRPIGH